MRVPTDQTQNQQVSLIVFVGVVQQRRGHLTDAQRGVWKPSSQQSATINQLSKLAPVLGLSKQWLEASLQK